MALELVVPSREHLDSYAAALRRGWSPDNLRAEVAAEQLAAIAADPEAFLAALVDREARGPAMTLPDGTRAPRLPGYRLWMWDGELVGSIGLRWQSGTSELPSYVLGHIGYAVVPWKRGRGYATEALRLMLEKAHDEGLTHVWITTEPDNVASRRVIEANGGVLVERVARTPHYGAHEALRYRIDLPRPSPQVDAAAARGLANEWVAAWNAGDLERIFALYADDFEMRSPLIVERGFSARGVLRGKAAIRPYWGAGIATADPPLRFELLDVYAGVGTVVIHYRSVGRRVVVEILELDGAGKIVRGGACHAVG